ncbi:hypothetical protein ACFVT1_33545 [Streptomyces sp. NPDC057963]|uniref:hypothetical protein n=1 Tax=Streptomyces sp. NPDC057963 TaxID=3346290 RepID=UPI0036EA9276
MSGGRISDLGDDRRIRGLADSATTVIDLKRLRAWLVPEVFGNEGDEEEEPLDRMLLFARLRSGEPVFRTGDAAAR